MRFALRRKRAPGLALLLVLLSGCGERPDAERIFLGGNIVTANPERPEVEALAVRHGRILAVGNREAVLALRGEETEITRLRGRALLPGFVHPHARPPGADDAGPDRAALGAYAERGFTTVTFFRPGAAIASLREFARSDRAPVRVQAYLAAGKQGRIPRLISDNDARFRVLGLALDARGDPLNAPVLAGHRGGYQVAVRTDGGQQVRRALDALARAHDQQERVDARHRLDGCTGIDRARLHRAGTLGATCSFRVGSPEAIGAGAGTAERLGMRFTVHDEAGEPADAPTLLEQMVVRADREERVPVDRAIRALTRDAAWQTHADHDRGQLKAGKYADLVLLDANPRKTKPSRLSEIEVLGTRIAGNPVPPAK
jgi:hypothetical protein